MALIISAVIILLFIYWNASLVFYRERERRVLTSCEEKCFSPRCKSIIYESGRKRAVLFIHGYPTAPNMYSYPAKAFSERGYDVYAPLIPTFGAEYKEFEKTNFTQWFSFIDRYYIALKERYEKVYVAGVSMGGAMTLKIAEKYSSSPLAPEKIAVLAAPVAYNSLLKDHFITSFSAYFGRTVALFVKEIGARCVDGIEGAEDGNENWTGYAGIFPRQGISLIYNLKKIRKDLSLVNIPLISIHDRGDRTVPFQNQRIIRENIKSKDAIFLSPKMGNYNHTHHSILMYDSTKKEYTDSILEFFDSQGGVL